MLLHFSTIIILLQSVCGILWTHNRKASSNKYPLFPFVGNIFCLWLLFTVFIIIIIIIIIIIVFLVMMMVMMF